MQGRLDETGQQKANRAKFESLDSNQNKQTSTTADKPVELSC